MDKAALLALADWVEKRTGPDRGVDAAIALATGKFFLAEPRYPGANRMYGYIDSCGSRVEPGNGGQYALIPTYTASLDATMTLIEDGDEWSVSTIYCIARAEVGINRDYQTSWPGNGEHAGCNPVLALLSAALRAKAGS